jgi:hypothetical protein
MKNTSRWILLLAALVLAGCNSNKDDHDSPPTPEIGAIDSNGNCTSRTISAYTDVGHKADMYNKSKDRIFLVSAQKACNDFKSLIGTKSCIGKVDKDTPPNFITADSVQATCEKVEDLLNPQNVTTPNAPPPEPIVVVDDEIEVSKLIYGVKLVIKDAATINALLSTDQILQSGKAVAKNEAVATDIICKLGKAETTAEVRDADVVRVSSLVISASNSLSLSGATTDRSITLFCLLPATETVWKLSHLKKAFGELAEVQVTQPGN